MRTLTKVAMASVLVAGVCGVVHNMRDEARAGTVSPNDRTQRQIITQGAGQPDQNLKLLIAVKLLAGDSPASNPRRDRHGRADTGEPSS